MLVAVGAIQIAGKQYLQSSVDAFFKVKLIATKNCCHGKIVHECDHEIRDILVIFVSHYQ